MAVDKTLITIVLRNLTRLDGNPVTADTLADLVTCDLRHTISVDRVRDALIECRNRGLVAAEQDTWGDDVWTIAEGGKSGE